MNLHSVSQTEMYPPLSPSSDQILDQTRYSKERAPGQRSFNAVEVIEMLAACLYVNEAVDLGLQAIKMLSYHLAVPLENDVGFLDKTDGPDALGLKFAAYTYSFARFYQP